MTTALNKDGTVTIQIKDQSVTLSNPSGGQLKAMRREASKIGNRLADRLEETKDQLSETQLALFEIAFTGEGQKKADGSDDRRTKVAREREQVWDNASEDDKTAVLKVVAELSAVLYEELGDFCAEWWADTIKELAGIDVEPDDLPAGLFNTDSINMVVEHFATTPFLFGLQ